MVFKSKLPLSKIQHFLAGERFPYKNKTLGHSATLNCLKSNFIASERSPYKNNHLAGFKGQTDNSDSLKFRIFSLLQDFKHLVHFEGISATFNCLKSKIFLQALDFLKTNIW